MMYRNIPLGVLLYDGITQKCVFKYITLRNEKTFFVMKEKKLPRT